MAKHMKLTLAKKKNQGPYVGTPGFATMCGAAEKQPGSIDGYQILSDFQYPRKDKIQASRPASNRWRDAVVVPSVAAVCRILDNNPGSGHQSMTFRKSLTYLSHMLQREREDQTDDILQRQGFGGLPERSPLKTDPGDWGDWRFLRYKANKKNVDPKGLKESPHHRHRDHPQSSIVVLTSLRCSCSFYVGWSNNEEAGTRPARGGKENPENKGKVLTLRHGDILVFDASRLPDGTGLVHGVDAISSGVSRWGERISIQWRMELGDRMRQTKHAWALANLAYFEEELFEHIFKMIINEEPMLTQNLTPPQNRISQLNYLSYRIDESENWAELRKTFFYAVHNITNNDDNLKKYLAQKLGPCFKHARSGFYNSWHLKKCRDIPDAVWSGFCLAPDLPFRAASWPTTKNDRNQKIYLRIWPRQECREYTQSHY